MEFWPADSRRAPPKQTHSRRSKNKDAGRAEADHPLVVHGGLGAARLRVSEQDKSRLEWTTLAQVSDGPRLQVVGEPVTLYPQTRAPEPAPRLRMHFTDALVQAQEASRILRTYYPEAHFPFDLLQHEFAEEAFKLSEDTFDPLPGNRLANVTIPAVNVDGTEADPVSALAFPSGDIGDNINVSPFVRNILSERLGFVPNAVPLESLYSPILQVTSHRQQRGMLGVRTRDGLTFLRLGAIVDDDNARPMIETQHFIRIPKDNLGKRTAIDLTFNPFVDAAALSVGPTGSMYQLDLTQRFPVQQYASDQSDQDPSIFRRLAWGFDRHTVFLATSAAVHTYDLRAPPASSSGSGSLFYQPTTPGCQFTSIDAPRAATNLLCCCTTTHLLWLDPRQASRPVLGWAHQRTGDRTLRASVLDIRGAGAVLVLVRTTGTGTGAEGLAHAFGRPVALRLGLAQRAGLVVGPSARPGDDEAGFSIFELGVQGEIGKDGCCHTGDGSRAPRASYLERVMGEQTRGAVWDEEVRELDLFLHDLDAPSAAELRTQGDHVHSVREALPTFWKSVEAPVEHVLNLYDLVFRAGHEPTDTQRADWLSGSAFGTRAGHYAFAKDPVHGANYARAAAVKWHADLTPTLRVLDPGFPVPPAADTWRIQAAVDALQARFKLNGASVSAERRMREAAEQVVIDNALAAYVYSVQPFATPQPRQTNKQDTTSSHLRSVSAISDQNAQDDDDDDKDAGMPLGVRLLLDEWTVGEDPAKYVFRDPYGLVADDDRDEDMASPPPPPAADPARKGKGKQKEKTQTQTQTQAVRLAPPVIVSMPARSASVPRIVQPEPQSQSQGQSQGEELMFASTQVVPGPFGGRPQTLTAVKKKPVKKRVGGF
ncbi:hypothetical protein BKA62DRAFT_829387 [Auriculariales sp. MPI-PUGE-AT-0066]|nr:hypothetical protein BKA62DRAFT_829387 [Auriculariales sp. MPI-PUGE-AT-0066]